MNNKLLVRIAFSALALGVSAPACAQISQPQGDRPNNLFDDSDGRTGLLCQLSDSRGGVQYAYRAAFQVIGKQISMPENGGSVFASAFSAPLQQQLAAGVRLASPAGKTGLREGTLYREDRSPKYATNLTLTLALDVPGAGADEPLVSRVFLDGQPVWYSGLHQPKPGTSHYEINRVDTLPTGDEPLHGKLDFVFESGGARVAALTFDASALDARSYLDATTTPILGRFYDRMVPPRGCR